MEERLPGHCEEDHVPFPPVAPSRRVRLDTLLSQRGLYASRSRAAASVLAGDVLLLPERRRAEKPGQLVPHDVELEVTAVPQFVSRGGIKLANALDALELDVSGRRAGGTNEFQFLVRFLALRPPGVSEGYSFNPP